MSDLSFYAEIRDLCYIRRANPEVITRRELIEGEEWFVVFDDPNQKLYKFKGQAGAIWNMLTGGKSVEAIVESLVREHAGGPEAVVKDVSRFIAKAGRKGLIRAAARRPGEQRPARYEDLTGCPPPL